MEVYSEEEESDSEGWVTRASCPLKWEEGLPVMRVGHQGPGPGPGPAMSTRVQARWEEEGDLG